MHPGSAHRIWYVTIGCTASCSLSRSSALPHALSYSFISPEEVRCLLPADQLLPRHHCRIADSAQPLSRRTRALLLEHAPPTRPALAPPPDCCLTLVSVVGLRPGSSRMSRFACANSADRFISSQRQPRPIRASAARTCTSVCSNTHTDTSAQSQGGTSTPVGQQAVGSTECMSDYEGCNPGAKAGLLKGSAPAWGHPARLKMAACMRACSHSSQPGMAYAANMRARAPSRCWLPDQPRQPCWHRCRHSWWAASGYLQAENRWLTGVKTCRLCVTIWHVGTVISTNEQETSCAV